MTAIQHQQFRNNLMPGQRCVTQDPAMQMAMLFGLHCRGGFGPMQRMQMAMAMMQMQNQLQTMMSQLLFGGMNCWGPAPMPQPNFPLPGNPGNGAIPGGMDFLKPELPKLCEGKWIAPHGGYQKLDPGRYLITKGEYKDHTLHHQGDGLFHVYDKCGCLKGQWQSPAAQDKIASPLVFDLSGDGKVDTTGMEKAFDINGDGKVDKTGWAGVGDGVLVMRDGTSGLDLFGDNTDTSGDGKADGHANGFEALRALAEQHIPGFQGDVLTAEHLQALADHPEVRLRMRVTTAPGVYEDKSLVDLGITQISLGYTDHGAEYEKGLRAGDEHGHQHRQIGEGFVMNGQTRNVNDVWFRHE